MSGVDGRLFLHRLELVEREADFLLFGDGLGRRFELDDGLADGFARLLLILLGGLGLLEPVGLNAKQIERRNEKRGEENDDRRDRGAARGLGPQPETACAG